MKSTLNSPVNSGSTQQCDIKTSSSTSECSLEKKSHPEKEMEAKIIYLSSFTVKTFHYRQGISFLEQKKQWAS